MKVVDFKTRYNNLVRETKILTSKVNVNKSQRFKYFEILTNQYILTYSYLDQLEGTKEYDKYLAKLEELRDVIVKYGLEGR